jgi:hypothetical protein
MIGDREREVYPVQIQCLSHEPPREAQRMAVNATFEKLCWPADLATCSVNFRC